MERRTDHSPSQLAQGRAQPVNIVVEEAHYGSKAHGRAGGRSRGQAGPYDCYFAGYHPGDAAQKYSLAVYGVGEHRCRYGHGAPAVDFREDVAEGTVALRIAHQVDCDIDYAPREQLLDYLRGTLAVEVRQTQEHGAAVELTDVGNLQRSQMYHDVGAEGLRARTYLRPGAHVGAVAVVDIGGGIGLHPYGEAHTRERAHGLGCKREALFGVVEALGQTDSGASARSGCFDHSLLYVGSRLCFGRSHFMWHSISLRNRWREAAISSAVSSRSEGKVSAACE